MPSAVLASNLKRTPGADIINYFGESQRGDNEIYHLSMTGARDASVEQQGQYKVALAAANINCLGLERVRTLRQQRDQDLEGTARHLRVVVDGRFTNTKLLKNLPANTTLIGRIRRDAKLFFLPQGQAATGCKRFYGQAAPTPEELLRDTSLEFQVVQAGWRYSSFEPLRRRRHCNPLW
jgi:hypothetical protein